MQCRDDRLHYTQPNECSRLVAQRLRKQRRRLGDENFGGKEPFDVAQGVRQVDGRSCNVRGKVSRALEVEKLFLLARDAVHAKRGGFTGSGEWRGECQQLPGGDAAERAACDVRCVGAHDFRHGIQLQDFGYGRTRDWDGRRAVYQRYLKE